MTHNDKRWVENKNSYKNQPQSHIGHIWFVLGDQIKEKKKRLKKG